MTTRECTCGPQASYDDAHGPGKGAQGVSASQIAPPDIRVTTLVSGLSRPWDIAFTPDGTMLFTQRAGVLSSRLTDGTVQTITADLSDLFASGETGLMGIVVDPRFLLQPSLLHMPGPHRARSTGDRLDHQCRLHRGHPGRRSPRGGHPRSRPSRRLPAALRTQRLSVDIDGRRVDRDSPAGPDLPRREGPCG